MQQTRWLAGLAAALLMNAAQADTGEDLVKKNGCMACHALATKMVGPAYKDVAAKYKGDAKAVDTLSAKVLSGGTGVWGQIPMPPHKGRVSEADAKVMVQYVLSIK